DPVALDRLTRVLRAGGREPAVSPPGGGEGALIEDDEQDEESRHFVASAAGSGIGDRTRAAASTRSTSVARSWCGTRIADRNATIMSRKPESGTRDQRRRTISRSRRRARLRCTAPPTPFLLATKPIRVGSPGVSSATTRQCSPRCARPFALTAA